MYIALQYGDLGSGTTDIVYLDDQVNYRIPITQFQAGSQTLPGGVGMGVHERGIYRSQLTQTSQPGTREILIPILVNGASLNIAFDNWHRLDRKLEQARRANGAYGQGNRVCLVVQFDGASTPVVFDVVDGSVLPGDLALPDGDPWLGGLIALSVYPYTRAPQVSYAAGSQIILAGTLYQAGVPGTVDGLLQMTFADQCIGGKAMNRLRGARKSLRPLGSSDYTGLYALVTAGSGTQNSDGTQYGAHYQRLATTAAWTTFAKAVSAGGARDADLYDLYLRVRDSSQIIAADSLNGTVTQQPGQGTLQPGTYTFFTVARNGSITSGISGSVETTVITVLAGGSTVVPANILLYDSDTTNDFRYFTYVSAGAVATTSTTLWDGSTHNVFDFSAATVLVNGTTQCSYGIYEVPKVPASGILSVRVRFKLISAPWYPTANSNQNTPLIVLSGNGSNSYSGLYASDYYDGINNYYGLSMGALTVNAGPGAVSTQVTPDTNWHVLEITYDTTGIINRCSVSLDGRPYAEATSASDLAPFLLTIGLSSGASQPIYVGEVVIADQYLGNSLSVVGGTAATVGWTADPNATAHDLFVSKDDQLGYYKLPLGNVSSYQLTQWPPTSATLQSYPTGNTPTLPSEVRPEVSVDGTNVQPLPGTPVAAQIGNGAWELVYLGTYPLPPVVLWEGGTAPLWRVTLQGKNVGPGSPTLDADLLVVFPHNEDQFVLEYPGGKAQNTTLQTWQLDTRYDGRVSGVLLDGGGVVQGTLDPTGRMFISPGDNKFVFIAEVQDANGRWITDAVNTKFTPQIKQIKPRYHYAIGQET